MPCHCPTLGAILHVVAIVADSQPLQPGVPYLPTFSSSVATYLHAMPLNRLCAKRAMRVSPVCCARCCTPVRYCALLPSRCSNAFCGCLPHRWTQDSAFWMVLFYAYPVLWILPDNMHCCFAAAAASCARAAFLPATHLLPTHTLCLFPHSACRLPSSLPLLLSPHPCWAACCLALPSCCRACYASLLCRFPGSWEELWRVARWDPLHLLHWRKTGVSTIDLLL